MKENIIERLEMLRRLFTSPIEAFIISSSDAHMSEYVAPHWEARKWFSGFTGSAGTLVITSKEAALWTDSRYFLQATEQLDGTGICLQKEMLPETPSIPAYLGSKLKPGDAVGIDGSTFSVTQVRTLETELVNYGIRIICRNELIDQAWPERPAIPENPVFLYPIEFSGKSVSEKIAEIRTHMNPDTALMVSALDEIAWTLNLRGNDIKCNPVFVSYLIITNDEVHLFINPDKLNSKTTAYLTDERVCIHHYKDIYAFLNQLQSDNLILSPDKTAYSIYQAVSPACHILEKDSPINLLKAVRNKTEIDGIHQVMIQDGVALVKFLKWLEEEVPGGKVTEISASDRLRAFRAEHPLYRGDSFDTIAGYKEHAAIVHYCASQESNIALRPEGFLLLDSGGQYLNGTTDITRTIALGTLNEEEKEDYTLVLKGHINLAMAKFPFGTRGAQLDVLARMPLWERGMNFLHGTGHGVGHFLNVHEGPQSIRMNENPVFLHPGMLTSNEPGIYKAGKHGIRIENLILTVPYKEGMFGNYLQFETVTLCPICTKGIRKDMLTEAEINWLNTYHEKVYTLLAPELNESEKSWLQQATQRI